MEEGSPCDSHTRDTDRSTPAATSNFLRSRIAMLINIVQYMTLLKKVQKNGYISLRTFIKEWGCMTMPSN